MKLTLIAAAALAAALPAQDRVTVFRGARVLPVAGPAIDDAVIVCAAGRVQVVGGAATSIPLDADVVDVSGKTITPGLVDAGSAAGLSSRDENEQGFEVTPQVSVLDAIDPLDKRFDRARRAGITTLQVGAGNRNVIGGLGVVLKNRPGTVREMVLRSESGLRLTLGREPSWGNRAFRGGTPGSIYYRRPNNRMGVVWVARKAFYDALDYRAQKTAGDGDAPPVADPGFEVLLRALDGELTVHTTARAEHDIRTALRLADEFGYETLIAGAHEAWQVVDELRDAGVRVLLSSPSELDAGARRDGAEQRYATVTALARAGVPFAIQTGPDGDADSLWREALFAMRNGLEPAAALAAVTVVPAEILGVEDRVGTLAAGRDADFVVWSGSPFDPTSRIEAVYVDGQETD